MPYVVQKRCQADNPDGIIEHSFDHAKPPQYSMGDVDGSQGVFKPGV